MAEVSPPISPPTMRILARSISPALHPPTTFSPGRNPRRSQSIRKAYYMDDSLFGNRIGSETAKLRAQPGDTGLLRARGVILHHLPHDREFERDRRQRDIEMRQHRLGKTTVEQSD